jgi:hypothetical protein
MSAANSAAKKRRAPPSMEPPRPSTPMMNNSAPQQPTSTAGMTLPQVIALIDKRLVNLETITKEKLFDGTDDSVSMENTSSFSKEILDEFNSRFEIMAEEIANIKNIVLSLQSYTMDVNKMLLDERTKLQIENTNIKFESGNASNQDDDYEDDFNNDPREDPKPKVPQWKSV